MYALIHIPEPEWGEPNAEKERLEMSTHLWKSHAGEWGL
jgi:hypothetical protein